MASNNIHEVARQAVDALERNAGPSEATGTLRSYIRLYEDRDWRAKQEERHIEKEPV